MVSLNFLKKKKRLEDRKLLDKFHSMRCAACSATPCDPAHIKSRGSGGDDVDDNLIALCRKHHTQHGAIGWFNFCEEHPNVRWILHKKGWAFNEYRKLVKL